MIVSRPKNMLYVQKVNNFGVAILTLIFDRLPATTNLGLLLESDDFQGIQCRFA